MDNSINLKQDELKKALKSVIAKDEFELHQTFVKKMSDELKISALDCAAALSLLNHPCIVLNNCAKPRANEDISSPAVMPKQKVVRYRIDVGRKHAISKETIRNVLIEVSGVDKNRIGRLDIRNYYSLVDLPDGMPADIFQLLSEMEINQRKLNIKRVRYQPRFYRRNIRK